MLHTLKHVRDHQNPLTDTTALLSCQAPQLGRPRFAAKEVCRHPHPPNMVLFLIDSTTSGDHRKPVLVRWIGIADPGQPTRTTRSIFRPEPKQLWLPRSRIVRQATASSISSAT